MKPHLEFKGALQIDQALQRMARSTAKRTARRAMSGALEVVRDAAVALAPVGPTGNLRDSVVVSTKLLPSQAAGAKREGRNEAVVYVGANAPHAHLVEFGTGPRFKKNGAFVGSMPPNPWMRPAWDSNVGAVLDELRARLWDEITATIQRAARREANAAKRAAKAKRKA